MAEQQQQQQQQQEPQLLKDNIWVAIRKAIIGFFKAFKAMSQLNEKIDKPEKGFFKKVSANEKKESEMILQRNTYCRDRNSLNQ